MSEAVIFIDESGDLGWNFSAKYRHGGSSQFLTISTLTVPLNKIQLPKRLVRDLYNHFCWAKDKEKKWAHMSGKERLKFALEANKMAKKLDQNSYKSITVYKPNVNKRLRDDSNILYNYMLGLLLIKDISKYQKVVLISDKRSIKVKCGNSLYDYLKTKLYAEENASTQLINQ